jgi:hypothetical protein
VLVGVAGFSGDRMHPKREVALFAHSTNFFGNKGEED